MIVVGGRMMVGARKEMPRGCGNGERDVLTEYDSHAYVHASTSMKMICQVETKGAASAAERAERRPMAEPLPRNTSTDDSPRRR
jgi:hypothetical protein